MIFIFSAILFESFADVLFKFSHTESKQILLWIGVVFYTIGTMIWAYSLKYEFLSKAISLFTILNLIIVTLAGVFIFKEELSLVNKIGILLGIISVFLIEK
jgi:multidrug transporter EmrE-like cation transporter